MAAERPVRTSAWTSKTAVRPAMDPVSATARAEAYEAGMNAGGAAREPPVLARAPTAIHDAAGDAPVTNNYDDQGRLLSTTDPAGNSVQNLYPGQPYTPPGGSATTVATGQQVVIDRMGFMTLLGYDQFGNVTNKVQYGAYNPVTNDLTGVVTTSSAFGDGNNPNSPTSTTDGDNNTTSYTYDPQGDTLTVTDANDHTTTTKYNGYGQPTDVFDATEVNTVHNEYDPATGNLTSTTDALGHVTSYQYNTSGTVAQVTDARGKKTYFSYDPANKTDLVAVQDPLGHVTGFAYDNAGDKILQTQTRTNALTGLPETLVTQFQYDGNGKLTGTLHPDGSLNQTFYTRLGKVDHTIDAAGHLRQYVYDSLGQQIMAFNPTNSGSSNGYTQTIYDFNGNPTQQVDQKGRITQTSYDGLGRAYRMQQLGTAASPLATPITTTTAYDGAGNVVSETDANGNTTQHAYDAANNKITDTDALGNVTNYGYDENNRLTSVTEPPQTHASYTPILIQRTTTYFYDQAGRQTMTILPDKVTATVTGYDELNRRTSFTDGSNRTTTYGYDLRHEVARMIVAQAAA
jgi:YD repeat-containing protein